MIDIISISEVKKGDILLIEGMNYNNQVCVVTVDRKTKDGAILFKEMNGLDYAPEDPDNIIRIGTKQEEPILTLLSQKMHLALSEDWNKKLSTYIKSENKK